MSGDGITTCPRCGGPLEFDEVDVGVGTIKGNPGCPDCHWVPEIPELAAEQNAVVVIDLMDALKRSLAQ